MFDTSHSEVIKIIHTLDAFIKICIQYAYRYIKITSITFNSYM